MGNNMNCIGSDQDNLKRFELNCCQNRQSNAYEQRFDARSSPSKKPTNADELPPNNDLALRDLSSYPNHQANAAAAAN